MAKKNVIEQEVANMNVLQFLKRANVCMTKRKIISKMLLPKTKTSVALAYLRKKKKIAIFASGKGKRRRVYWGVV